MPNAKVIPFDGEDRGRPAKSRARAGLEVDEEQPDVYSMVEEFEESPELGERTADLMAFVRRRVTGEYEVDDFGYDPELLDRVIMAPFRPLYSRYFRVETRGLENVPDIGGGLVVANHSGTVALDAVMTKLALLDHHPAHQRAATPWRAPRMPSGCWPTESWWGSGRRATRGSVSPTRNATNCSDSVGAASLRRHCVLGPRSFRAPSSAPWRGRG